MKNIYSTNDYTLLNLTFITVILFFVALALYFYILSPIMRMRKYFKSEIQRSQGKEKEYWKKKLRKLYMQYIPFIGRFFK